VHPLHRLELAANDNVVVVAAVVGKQFLIVPCFYFAVDTGCVVAVLDVITSLPLLRLHYSYADGLNDIHFA